MELLNYINISIDILSTLKVNEIMEKHKKTKNANISEDFESLLIREEAVIRSHIALSNKIKLENDTYKVKIDTYEEEQKKFDEKIKKIKEEYENKINDLNKEIENLNKIKNELEKNAKINMEKLELKEKEINNLKFEINNLMKTEIKSNKDIKKIDALKEKLLIKNNSSNIGIKFKINNSDLEPINKYTNAHPNSARHIYKFSYISQIGKLSRVFIERNKLFNSIEQIPKTNPSLIKKENSIFSGFNNSYYINGSDISRIKRIKQNFSFIDASRNNSKNNVKTEDDENLNIKKTKGNKNLLLPRNGINKLTKNFYSINKKDKGDNYEEYIKKINNKKNILINAQQEKKKLFLINQPTKKIFNENSISNINSHKKEYKQINKFRISSVNKDSVNKGEISLKMEERKKNFIPNKVLEDKSINNTNNDIYTSNSIINNNITAFKISTKKIKKINFEIKKSEK